MALNAVTLRLFGGPGLMTRRTPRGAGEIPLVDHTPMLEVADRLDVVIHPIVDLDHVGPGLGYKYRVTRRRGARPR